MTLYEKIQALYAEGLTHREIGEQVGYSRARITQILLSLGIRSTRPIGFLSMTPERHREIARMGSKAANEKGVAHHYNSEEAREAGRKGGAVRRAKRDARIHDTEADE
jgi:general stress protein YciG